MADARERRGRLLVALGGGFSVGYVLYLAIAPGSDRSVTVASDWIQCVVPLCIAAPMAAAAARRTVGRERVAWFLLAAASLAWGLGQLLWTWFEVIDGTEAPFPSWADVGFLAAVPFLLAGVAVYPARLLALGRAR